MDEARAKSVAAIVIALVFAVLLFQIAYPLTMGYLFPWEPPTAPEAPRQAVLRITAPEGEPYTIEWGGGFSSESVVSRIPEGDTYRDYPVPSAAFENSADGFGDFDATVYVGADWPHDEWEEGDLGMVFFVEGEYAQCEGASSDGVGAVYVDWGTHEELGGTMNRIICGSYRYA